MPPLVKRMTNKSALADARALFPGGVNSPVRAYGSVGGNPPFIASGSGAYCTDVEGQVYLDYVGSWGPLILGHAHPEVVAAVTRAASSGLSFGAPTEAETRLGRLIQRAFPSLEKMRFVSSGTEATMSAIRVARGFTGRSLIVKCDGAYHGHGDALLVSAGSGVATLAIPGCPGVPAETARQTVVIPFNDAEALAAVFAAHPGQVAAFVIEPVCGNMGVVPPRPGYLERVRGLTSAHGAVLIFDEVMTGFRACFGGVQTIAGVRPDMTCLGKIVGGGMPLAVYGGRAEIMACVAPDGPVYQAGTLSGNPVAVAAGTATLELLANDSQLYDRLTTYVNDLSRGLPDLAASKGIALTCQQFGSMFTGFFTDQPVTCFADARSCDLERFKAWFVGMLREGMYLAPSQFEAGFVSAAHGAAELERTLAAAAKVLTTL